MVRLLEEEMCETISVQRGTSLYRHDYVLQEGHRAERMPPPPNKGGRCVNPCSFQETDTLYRKQFRDFWKMGDRKKLELYRGKRTDPAAIKKQRETEASIEQEPYEIIATPAGTTVQDVLRDLEMKQKSNNCEN